MKQQTNQLLRKIIREELKKVKLNEEAGYALQTFAIYYTLKADPSALQGAEDLSLEEFIGELTDIYEDPETDIPTIRIEINE